MNDEDYNTAQPSEDGSPAIYTTAPSSGSRLPLVGLVAGIVALMAVIAIVLLLMNQNSTVKTVSLGGGDTRTPALILGDADTALSTTATLRYTMTATFSNLPGGGDKPSQLTLSGEMVRPDRYTMRGPSIGEVLVIGPDSWRRPPGGDWVKGSSGLGGLIDPNTLADSSKYYTDVQRLSDEEVDGVACYHLKFMVDTTRLMGADSGLDLSGATIAAESWIGKQDSLERQLRLDINLPSTGGNITGTVNIKLSGFKDDITIVPPQ